MYHKKNSEIQGIHVLCFNIIHFVQFFYQAFGVPPTPLNFREW